jgi:hypothetical protein
MKITEVKLCDKCHLPLGVSTIYKYGKRYHPDCFILVYGQAMIGEDWSMGKYET